MKTVLVTGCSGGIGSILVPILQNQNIKVYGIDVKTPMYKFDSDKFEFRMGSILDERLMSNLRWEDFDTVIHLAAISSLPECQNHAKLAFDTNFFGLVNITENIIKYGKAKIINASSSSVYEGNNFFPFHEELTCSPHLIYPQTKLMSELYLSGLKISNGLPSVSLRFFNIIGPYQDYSRTSPPIVNYLIREFINSRSPILHHDGEQRRDYISVYDACSAIIAAEQLCGLPENLFNVCSGKELTINEIVALIKSSLKTEIEPTYRSSDLLWKDYLDLYLGYYPLNNDVVSKETMKRSVGTADKFVKATGWSIRFPVEEKIEQICREAVSFMKNE
jgi:UDP-glucose 4-epimerase